MALTQIPNNMLAFDGGAMGFKNRVINGCARVAQRSSVSLSGSNQFGQVDRMLGSLAGSGLGGTFIQQVDGLASGMTCKRGVKFNDISFTSGYITFRHRIEAVNVRDMSSKTVTVSAKIYHDYGSTVSFSIGLRKPSTTADTFSATSAITASDVATSVPTGTTTTISAVLALGSAEADLGLEVVIYHSAITASVKNVVIGDIQLELGSIVTPFEVRSIGTELALCQRYFQTFAGQQVPMTRFSASAGSAYAWIFHPEMRTAATVTFGTYSTGSGYPSSGAMTYASGVTNGFKIYSSDNVSANTTIYFVATSNTTLSAEL